MFVCGARGRGNETDKGMEDASPFVKPSCSILFWRSVAMSGNVMGVVYCC